MNDCVINEKTKKGGAMPILKIICASLFVVAILLYFASVWFVNTYGAIGFDSILFTLFSNLKGVDKNIIKSFMLETINPVIIASEIMLFLLFFKIKKPKIAKIKHISVMVICFLLSAVMLVNAGNNVGIYDYIYGSMHQTELYSKVYVDPNSAEIVFPEQKRNLIYIFLESVETSFMSKDEGGALEHNAMPELTRLAEENVSFSHNDGIGGFLNPTGTTWTASAMVAQTAGIPLKGTEGTFEINKYGKENFLPGASSIINVLKENCYNQALMVGSKASFANRNVYYEDHGIDTIYDLNTARNDGIIPKDYYVWWGMEDKYLFEYAKEKISDYATQEEPFSFSLLTVDTHFPKGYKCSLCDDEFEEQYDNVISCSSKQVNEFVNWIKAQDFYENTTIVIAGDHLTMDNNYIKRNVEEGYERRVYNCIINPAAEPVNCKNRVFTSIDMFPTTLAAMGCKIEGERLGLGTNMFSDTPTLAEEMGYDELDRQFTLNSSDYIKKFAIE